MCPAIEEPLLVPFGTFSNSLGRSSSDVLRWSSHNFDSLCNSSRPRNAMPDNTRWLLLALALKSICLSHLFSTLPQFGICGTISRETVKHTSDFHKRQRRNCCWESLIAYYWGKLDKRWITDVQNFAFIIVKTLVAKPLENKCLIPKTTGDLKSHYVIFKDIQFPLTDNYYLCVSSEILLLFICLKSSEQYLILQMSPYEKVSNFIVHSL